MTVRGRREYEAKGIWAASYIRESFEVKGNG